MPNTNIGNYNKTRKERVTRENPDYFVIADILDRLPICGAQLTRKLIAKGSEIGAIKVERLWLVPKSRKNDLIKFCLSDMYLHPKVKL